MDPVQAPAEAHIKDIYLEFLKKLGSAKSEAELNFILINESFSVWSFDRAYLIEKKQRSFQVLTVSGMVEVTPNTPAHSALVGWLSGQQWDATQPMQKPVYFAEDSAHEYLDALLSNVVLGVPLGAIHASGARHWILTQDQVWTPSDLDHMHVAGRLYEQRRKAMRLDRPRWIDRVRQPGMRVFALVFIGLILVLMLLKVPATVSAPAEIVPLRPHLVTAPQDGVVREVIVAPNSDIQKGQLLVVLDDDVAVNRRKITLESLNIAKTDALIASQKAFSDDRGKAELNIALGKIAEKEAELKAIDAQISKVEIRADRRGVAVFTDPNDWRGRPVQTGERIMQIAQPEDAGVLVWLSVSDALQLARGDTLTLFLHIDPLTGRKAEVTEMGYQPEIGPDSVSSYRIKARLVDGGEIPRLGLRGVARLSGDEVSLGYYLFRRPLAYVWRYLNWSM